MSENFFNTQPENTPAGDKPEPEFKFGQESKDPDSQPEAEITPPISSTEEDALSQDMHTMPEKFIKQNGGNKKKLWIIIALVAVVVVVGALVAVYFFTDLFNSQETVVPVENQNTNVNQVVTNVNTQANTNNANTNVNANSNANQNVNSANANTNVNGNLNANDNQNTNISNQNLNQNTNVSNSNSNSNTNVNISKMLPSSKDTDADSLTDVEEELYETNTTKADTDGDGYFDGAEILAGFSPLDVESVKLKDTEMVTRYTNSEQGYNLYYPTSWVARAVNQKKSEIVIAASTGEYIQIAVQDNSQNLTTMEWYQQLSGEAQAAKATALTIASTQAVLTPDLSTVYLTKNKKMYVITYNAGSQTEVNYRTTFKMMYQGINFTTPTLTETESNTNSANNSNTNTGDDSNSNSNTNAS